MFEIEEYKSKVGENGEIWQEIAQAICAAYVPQQPWSRFSANLRRRMKSVAPELARELAHVVDELEEPDMAFYVCEEPAAEEQQVARSVSRSATAIEFEWSAPETVRVEDPARPDRTPVFADSVWRALRQLVGERELGQDMASQGLAPAATAIFTGPPGVGKTLSARWIAQQLGRPLVVLDLATVVSHLLGKTGNNLKVAFEFAKKTPCVFFLDELDALAKRRDDSSDVGELKRLVTVLIQELDQWPNSHLLLAASNHAELLDPAIWRRFDYQVEFPPPTAEQLSELLAQAFPAGRALAPEWLAILPCVLQGKSQHELLREAGRLARVRLVQGDDAAAAELQRIIEANVAGCAREAKKALAVQLVTQCRVSQRQANLLTGVSRDAIRSACRKETKG